MSSLGNLPAPRSILLIRLGAMGDIIMSSALIPALRNTFPEARITWLTSAAQADLLTQNPRLNQVYLWQGRRQWPTWKIAREFLAMRKTLRQESFDWVLDLQGLLKSGVFAGISGGQFRIGLGSREGSQWFMSQVIERRSDFDERIGSEYLKLALTLGLETGEFAMDIPVSAQADAEAQELLRQSGVPENFAVFCPFTTRPQKHWLDERWGELAEQLRQHSSLPAVLLGAPADVPRSQGICGDRIRFNLTGKTNLQHCAAILRRARLAIGVDTGLTHLGIAQRTPTLALFGSTRPYLDSASPGGKVLYQARPCSPCRKRPTCHGEFTCMSDWTVPQVLAEALDRLKA
jgi:heptosyltransferase-1